MKLRFFIPLCLIVLLGACLRFYKISTNPPGLYVDEAGIAINAYDILIKGKDEYNISYPLAFRSFDDYKMPGYIYLTAVSFALFGKNEFAVRFPSAFFGTLTIFFVALLVREVFLYHKSTGKHADVVALLAGLLFAILPWHLLLSRGGFEVTVALFFYVVGLFSGILFLKTNKRRYVILTSLLFLCAMYTYHSYRIIAPISIITGLMCLFKRKKMRKNLYIGLILFLIVALPLFFFSITGGGMARFSQTSAFTENPFTNILKYPADVVIYVRNYFSYFSLTYFFSYGDQINRHQVNDFGLLYLWQLPFVFSGLYFLTKTQNKLLRSLMIVLVVIGPLPAALADPSPHSLRFLLGTVIFSIFSILGLYMTFLQKKRWVPYLFVGVAVFALIEFAYYLHYYYVHYPKEAILDWGGGCKQIAQKIQEEKNQYREIAIDKNVGCVREYFDFYIPRVSIHYVDPGKETVKSEGGATLYIRPYYGSNTSSDLAYRVMLPTNSRTPFAEFWKL